MNEKKEFRIQNAIERAEDDIRYSTKRLIELSEGLAKCMNSLSEGLKNQGDRYYSINSIGEVQSWSTQIDCECAKLSEKRNNLKSLLLITKE